MRILLIVFLAISSPAFAADGDALVGTWRLVSWQVIAENQPPQNQFGAHPKGFVVLTSEGRFIVLTTAENRNVGMSDTEGRLCTSRWSRIAADIAWRAMISSLRSKSLPRAYCFRERQRCAGSCGNDRSNCQTEEAPGTVATPGASSGCGALYATSGRVISAGIPGRIVTSCRGDSPTKRAGGRYILYDARSRPV